MEITLEEIEEIERQYTAVVENGKVWDMVIAGLSQIEIITLLEERLRKEKTNGI